MHLSLLLFFLFMVACSFSYKVKDGTSFEPMKHDFTVGGSPLSLWSIPAGTIQIKTCHFENCLDDDASYPRRLLDILLTREPHQNRLPIFAFLIEHPEGRFLIDAGGDKRWAEDESWRCDRMARVVSRRIADVAVARDEDLLGRLAAIGVEAASIRAAVITHLHFDHTAALPELGVKTYLGGADLDGADHIGAVPCKYLDGVETVRLETLLAASKADPARFGDKLFGASYSLTSDGRLRLYATPGHTPGSISVALETDQGSLWFIGDTAFSDRAITPESRVAGMHFDIPAVRDLHKKLQRLATTQTVILIPSHDSEIDVKIEAFRRRF